MEISMSDVEPINGNKRRSNFSSMQCVVSDRKLLPPRPLGRWLTCRGACGSFWTLGSLSTGLHQFSATDYRKRDRQAMRTYDVEMWWTVHSTRSTDVPVKIYDGNTLLKTVYVNQQQAGGQWNVLGTYEFSTQARVVITCKDSRFSTSADAMRFFEKIVHTDKMS